MRDQWAAWIRRDTPSEKKETLEFNLEAANVNMYVVVTFLYDIR